MTPRHATEDDIDAMAEVLQSAMSNPWSRRQLSGSLALPSTRCWVLGTPIIGVLVACSLPPEGEILSLAVDKAARRRGAASALIAACETGWASEGVTTAWLEVRDDNLPAVALYHARGWTNAGIRAKYYADRSNARILRWSAP